MPYYVNQPREYQSVVDPYFEGKRFRQEEESAGQNALIRRNQIRDYEAAKNSSNALAQNPSVSREQLMQQAPGNEGMAAGLYQKNQQAQMEQVRQRIEPMVMTALTIGRNNKDEAYRVIYDALPPDMQQKAGDPSTWNDTKLSQWLSPDNQAKVITYMEKIGDKEPYKIGQLHEIVEGGKKYQATYAGKGQWANKQLMPASEKTAPEDLITLRQLAKDLPKLKTEATTQGNNIGQIDKAITLLKTGNVTGKSGQVKAFLAPYAEAVGMNTQGMDDAQTFQLLARQIIGPMRLDIIGAGPVSEWEQKLMQQMSGGGGAGTQAAYELLTAYRKMAESKIQNYNDTLAGGIELDPNIGKIHKPVKAGRSQARTPQASTAPRGNVAPAGTKAKLPNGKVVTSDGRGGWQ